MDHRDKEARRVGVRSLFSANGFALAEPKVKADKFQSSVDCYVYFYWNQGDELHLSIDPRTTYLTLLNLVGVSVPKQLIKVNGLRAGSTMKEFPSKYEEVTPVNSQSHVGRMFAVKEIALPSFLSELLSVTASKSDLIKSQSKLATSVAHINLTNRDETSSINDDENIEGAVGSTSQGYESDPIIRRVIEQYAVAHASNHYSKNGYKVTELGKPFDLLCVRNLEAIHVEVKGSRSMLSSVILTVNEVKDARVQKWRSDLFIVESICIDVGIDTKPTARAGNARVLHSWDPKDADLSPSQFSYTLPDLSEWVPIPLER